MEFWGEEIKPGQALKVAPGVDKVLHLSQASLGELKKDKGEAIILHVNVDGQKLVVGTLFPGKTTHISYDLIFEKEFELSHTGKTGSVYFCGYKSVLPVSDSEDDMDDTDSDSEEDIPVIATENGKPEDNKAKKDNAATTDCCAGASKTESAEAKKVKLVDPKKGKKPMADDDDESSDSEDSSDDEEMADSDDDSDDSSDEEEATPEKVQQGKKGPAESAPKEDKKAKLVTPQKSGGDAKKGSGHTATPYPKGGKTPAAVSGDKSKQQSPKSGNQSKQQQQQQSPKSGGQKRNFSSGGGGRHSNKKGKHSGGK